MSQFARPESDVTIGLWEDDGGGTVNLFDAINEIVASDADFIISELITIPGGPIDEELDEGFTSEDTLTSPYITKLSSVVDPGVDTGFKLRFRIAKDLPGGNATGLFIELRQDYIDEILLGTLIAARTQSDLSDTVTEFEFELTEAEAGLITDFSNLFLRFQFAVS